MTKQQIYQIIHNPKWIKLLTFAFTALLGFRLFYFVHTHTANVLYMDQWDIYRGLFQDFNLWEAFRLQHGSHRQGIGALLSYGLAHLTGLSSFWEAHTMVSISILNSALAVWLLRKLIGHWHVAFALIPFLFINISSYEVYLGAPNPAHGLLPQTLALLIAACHFLKNNYLKTALLSVLLFLIMHTGYGYFMVFFYALFAFAELLSNIKQKKHLFLSSTFFVIIAAILGCFFINYATPMSTEEKQSIGLHYLWKLPAFATGLFSRTLGASRVNFVMLPAALVLGSLIFFSVRDYFSLLLNKKLITKERKILLILAGFSLLFTFAASFGRAPGGIGASISSRYIPFITLGLLAFMAYWIQSKHKWSLKVLFAFSIFFSIQELRPRGRDAKSAQEFYQGKLDFKNCYLQSEDFDKCNNQVDFYIYPPKISGRIPPRLDFLKERDWSLFK
ncbi:hypothetical protein GW915_02755 [bacterium]|nr:hypothetical protein [bacterium]